MTATSEGRVRRLRPEELDERQRELYDSFLSSPRTKEVPVSIVDEDGRLLGPYNYYFVDTIVGGPARALAKAIGTESGLPGRLREVTILEVARTIRSEFEWHAHVGIARNIGLSDAEIDAIREGREATTLSEEEAVVRALVRALIVDRDLPDELYARAQELFGEKRFYDLVMLAGHYVSHALVLTAYREPLPPGASPAFRAEG